uniref:Secreted protein n=1 Tax=Phakopsora pachyrhizi TaxID=170000 RepID=A0A0S1MJK5_PHAPC
MTLRLFKWVGFLQLLLRLTSAQDTSGTTPLYQKKFPWPNVPYRADTGDGPRGTQQGYNKCNSTTQNQDSLCQTTFLNSIQEFCLWGAIKPNSIVGNIEGEMVAYCTTKKFGTRLIPSGAITGVQLTRTPGYIQVVGFIDQTALNLQANDTGGEEDPHGADQRGNPLGALMYSSAFNSNSGASSGQSSNSTSSSSYTQVSEWSFFIGSGVFCYKACDPAGPNAPQLCQHIYDRIGCAYNAPANYPSINGTYQSCQGENQLPAGTYIENGVTKTYQQPPESLGPITSIPYTAPIPAVSNCVTYKDPVALWPDLPKTQTVANTSSTVNRKGVSSSTSDGSKQSAQGGAQSAASSIELPVISLLHPIVLGMVFVMLA